MAFNQLQVVVGLGKTGLSAVEYLVKQGFTVAATDSRDMPPALDEIKQRYPDVQLSLGQFDQSLLLSAARIILSPGVPRNEVAIQAALDANIPVMSDIELFAQSVKGPVIGITGTNGKSTVTSMLAAMVKEAKVDVKVGGNIGTPALDLLDDDTVADLYILELSSFQLETVSSLRLKAATILNIEPDHMDRYETLADYIQAKQRIYQHCETIVYNKQDKNTQIAADVKMISFCLASPADGEFGLLIRDNQKFLAFGDRALMPVSELRTPGSQNWQNALAAFALGSAIGLSFEDMASGLRKFTGLIHRCQWVREFNRINWYNDSKGTNVSACKAAVLGLSDNLQGGRILLIAGGQGKQGDFASLNPVLVNTVREVILLGEDADIIADAIAETKLPIQFATDLPDAIERAKQTAEPGDAVLLSPACASFDMFDNYEHRGNVFMELVKRL